jgi:hypothetical protein
MKENYPKDRRLTSWKGTEVRLHEKHLIQEKET